MTNNVKTPAQLKADQIKANNQKANPNQTAALEKEKVVAEDPKILANKLAEANRLLKESEKKAKTLEVENAKLIKEQADAVTEEKNPAITNETMVADKPKDEPKSLNHKYFTITVTNKSLSYSGFQFNKWEKYAITGRNSKAIDELIERKLWKIVKA